MRYTLKENLVSKDAQCSETDFGLHDIFNILDMVDFVFNIRSELGTENQNSSF